MEAAVLFIVFAILLFMGAPIAVCLGVSSIAAMLVMLAGRPVDIILGTVPQLVSAGHQQGGPAGHTLLHPGRQHHGRLGHLAQAHPPG